MSHLTNGRINLGQVREATRRQLLKCLDDCSGSKAIVWDDKLTSPVGLIAEYSLLKEHDVGKMFPLISSGLPYCDEQNLIFLVFPRIDTMDIIADTIKRMLQERHSLMSKKDYHIYFVPRKSVQCELRLKDLEVYNSFTNIGSFDLSLIPFDNDVMSLEYEKAFMECVLEEDLSCMYNVATSLMTLQALYGVIPKIYGKGDLAKHVTDIMVRKRKEMSDIESQTTPLIDNLILIDRSVDLITPMLTQLTYEGLIDENFRIENTSCQLPPEKFPPKEDQKSKQSTTAADTSKQKAKKVNLNSSESLFSEIRDMNFSAVGPVLSREAKRITAEYKEHQSAKTVGEMKEFVHKLPHIQAAKQALALHTSIAEYLKEQTDSDSFRDSLQVEQEFFNGIETDKAHPYIEKCLGMKEPLNKVLRLICLQCAVNNGFKLKLLDYYKREIIHTYGFEHLLTIADLEKVGLIRSSAPRLYPVLKKTFRLVVDDVQEQNPNDIAYVHSGYAPLSVRLVQHLERQVGWRGIEDILRQIPGATVEKKQYVPPALLKKNVNTQGSPKLTLVYFLGGCTYSEIAALRFLAQQENALSDYVIATTKIINGNVLLSSLTENLDPQPVSG